MTAEGHIGSGNKVGMKIGSIEDHNITSVFLDGNRRVQVYLPPSYESTPNLRFPALYLHDGQNVFSSAGPDAAKGWGSWNLDLTVDSLCHERRMQEIIMVAVDNSSARLEEYNGIRPSPGRPPTPFQNYEAFLVTELKPWADAQYRTNPEAFNNALMGSSMGGLCSIALGWYHPEVFGAAASLSGAFRVNHSNFLDDVLKEYHGAPKPLRVYLDSGVADSMGGDDGNALTGEAVSLLRRIGWKQDRLRWFVDTEVLDLAQLEGSDLRYDKRIEATKSQHNEFYWKRRSWRALEFLFPLK